MGHLPRIILDAALFCPHCGNRHVDESRNGEKWHRRAHTTHRCQNCGRDFDVFVSGAEPTNVSEVDPSVFRAPIPTGWSACDLDRLTAALALPVNATGADVAEAARALTRRCEELEHKLLAFQESSK